MASTCLSRDIERVVSTDHGTEHRRPLCLSARHLASPPAQSYDDNDNLKGADGDDAIRGGNGNDLLTGSAGNDSLLSDAGSDKLNGGLGTDIINSGPLGTDTDTISDSTKVIDTSFDFDALLADLL